MGVWGPALGLGAAGCSGMDVVGGPVHDTLCLILSSLEEVSLKNGQLRSYTGSGFRKDHLLFWWVRLRGLSTSL